MEFGSLSPRQHAAEPFGLLCEVLSPSARSQNAIQAFTDPERTAAILALAEEERVAATLHEAVAAHFSEVMAKADRAVLATHHEANRRRNAALRTALLELGKAGASSGFQFAALKGAAWLIEDAAGCAPWRSMVDLDILVRPEQFDAVPQLLERMGYVKASTSKRFNGNFHHAPYRHPNVPATLEVHRHIGWQHRLLPPETVFANAQPLASGLLLPAPWARAFHAIIHWQIQDHGSSRGILPLKDLVEVAHFLARADVEWMTLAAHAESVGTVEACKFAVASATTLLGAQPSNAPIPPAIAPDAAAKRWVERSVARRASPLRAWLATQVWRAGTLWRCEKIVYRCALRGMRPNVIVLAVWAARVVQLPILATRAIGIAVRALARFSRPGAFQPH
jgi:hypothetical protein